MGELSHDLKNIYIDSFHPDERREWDEMPTLLSHPQFRLNQVIYEQKLIGFITTWNLLNFTFIEHFAIDESVQGKGLGTQIIKQVMEENSTMLVLEVEEPTDELTRRRISFYKRLGFSVCEGTYYQPPYSPDKCKVKMLLMSDVEKITPLEFDQIKTQLYQEVYQLK